MGPGLSFIRYVVLPQLAPPLQCAPAAVAGHLGDRNPKEDAGGGGVNEIRDDRKGRELWRQMLQSAEE